MKEIHSNTRMEYVLRVLFLGHYRPLKNPRDLLIVVLSYLWATTMVIRTYKALREYRAARWLQRNGFADYDEEPDEPLVADWRWEELPTAKLIPNNLATPALTLVLIMDEDEFRSTVDVSRFDYQYVKDLDFLGCTFEEVREIISDAIADGRMRVLRRASED